MADLLGQKIVVKIDADISGVTNQLNSLEAQINKLSGKAINVNVAGLEQATGQAKRAGSISVAPSQEPSSQARRAVAEARAESLRTQRAMESQLSRQAGGRTTSKERPTNLFGSDARGDRGGLGGRLRSVAEYAVAAQVVRAGFDAFGKGISTIVEVQNQVQQLNKVLGTSKKQLDDLRSSAISTAKQYGLATTEVLKGFTLFAQQGKTPEEVKKLGKTVALAANVSEFGTQELSEVVSTGMLTFGKQLGNNAEKLIDSFLAVEAKYAVSESDLAEVMKRIGPQAAVGGVSLDQLNALTTIMKEQTRAPAEEIATSLRFMMKNVYDPKTMKSIERAFGGSIKFTTKTGDLRSSFDILQDMANLFPNLDRRQRVFLANQVAETRFASKFIGLMQGFGEAGKIIGISQNANGTAFERNQIVMQSLQKQMQKTGAAFEGASLAIGEGFVQPAMTFLKILEKSLNVVEKISSFNLSNVFGKEGGPGADQGTGGPGILSYVAPAAALYGAGKLLGIGGAMASRIPGIGGVFGGAGRVATAVGTGTTTIAAGGALPLASAGMGAGASAVGAVAQRGLFGKVFNVLSGGFFGDLIGTFLKGTLSQVLKKVALQGIIGTGLRAAGGFLGSAGGPIGTIAGFAISTAMINQIGKLFESGLGKAERFGAIETREAGTTGATVGTQLGTAAKNLISLEKEMQKTTAVGDLSQQREAVKQQRIDRTAPEIAKEREEIALNAKNIILQNETLLRATQGIAIDNSGKVSFNGRDVNTDSKALLQLASRLRSTQETQTAIGELGVGIDVLPEKLGDSLKESGSDIKDLLSARALASQRGAYQILNLGTKEVSGRTLTEQLRAQRRREWEKMSTAERLDNMSFTYQPRVETAPGMSLRQIDLLKKEMQTGEITSRLLKPLSEAAAAAADTSLGSREIATKLEPLVGGQVPKELEQLLRARYSPAQLEKAIGPDMGVEEALQMLLFRSFEELSKKAEQFGKNVEVSLKGGENSAENIKSAMDKASEGDLVKFIDKQGTTQLGKVITDQSGFKSVKLFREEAGAGAGVLANTVVRPLLALLKGQFQEVSILRPEEAVGPGLSTADKDLIRSGFGSSIAYNIGKGFQVGADSLLDFNDQMAGTFTGFTKKGIPTFNTGLQEMLLQATKLQDEAKESPPETREGVIKEESLGILARSVEALGKAFKSFELSVQKLQQFQNKQQAAASIPIAQTGLLSGLGNLPQLELGKEKRDLNPTERAFAAMPATFRQLSTSQVAIGEMQNQFENLSNIRDSLERFLRASSPEARAAFNIADLQQLFANNPNIVPQGMSSVEALQAIDDLIKAPAEGTDISSKAEEVIDALLSNIEKMQTSTLGASDIARQQARPLETAVKTGVALAQLQISAEQAAQALENLQKFDSLFQNTQKALGEGPFGLLGSKAPFAVLRQKGQGPDEGQVIDFSKMTEFEKERRILQIRSSEDYRRGRTSLEIGGQVLPSLSEEETRAARRELSFREKQARASIPEAQSRTLLKQNVQTATQMITGIQDILDRGGITTTARTGLTQMQGQLMSISNLPEQAFLKGGKVNLSPFNILQEIPGKIDTLLKGTGITFSQRGGEKTTDTQQMVGQQQTTNQILTQILSTLSGKPIESQRSTVASTQAMDTTRQTLSTINDTQQTATELEKTKWRSIGSLEPQVTPFITSMEVGAVSPLTPTGDKFIAGELPENKSNLYTARGSEIIGPEGPLNFAKETLTSVVPEVVEKTKSTDTEARSADTSALEGGAVKAGESLVAAGEKVAAIFSAVAASIQGAIANLNTQNQKAAETGVGGKLATTEETLNSFLKETADSVTKIQVQLEEKLDTTIDVFKTNLMTELDGLRLKTTSLEESLLNKENSFNYDSLLSDIAIAKEQALSVKQDLETVKAISLVFDAKLQYAENKANEADNKAQQAYSAAMSSLGNQR